MTGAALDALLIGVDAGCLPVFRRLFEEDRLQNLQRLCSDGVSVPLESQIPPWTPSAWPSLYTGVNPGKHGVYGFVTHEGYDWRVVNADDVDEFTLWELLDRHGRSSVVVNAPVTHPPTRIDGAILPGFIGPEEPDCHPEGLLEEVREATGDYRVYPSYHTDDRSYDDAEKRAEYADLIRMRGRAFDYLVDRFEPEFGFVQFQRTDTVFHEFDGEWETVRAVYEALDEAVGEVLEATEPRRVFLASDHGMGTYDRPVFRVNDYLREAGYVTATRGGKGMPGWSPMRDQFRRGETPASWEPTLSDRLAARAASVGLTADRVRAGLERVGLADLVSEYAPSTVSRTGREQVDFAASRAYLRARTELGVRINLSGREPDGSVPPEAYDRVREDLIGTLRDARTPGGDPVFEAVGPREEFFHGPHLEEAPDVVVVPYEFDHFLSDQLRGSPFGQASPPWNHKRDGIFVAAGEDVDASATADLAPRIFDVAPTILASLGVPPSDRMDGRVLPVASPVEPVSVPDYAAGDTTAAPDGVERKLSDLGYLD